MMGNDIDLVKAAVALQYIFHLSINKTKIITLVQHRNRAMSRNKRVESKPELISKICL